jgi:hypothetical protein
MPGRFGHLQVAGGQTQAPTSTAGDDANNQPAIGIAGHDTFAVLDAPLLDDPRLSSDRER